MKLLVAAIALATLAVATPAFARDKEWYVGVEGGLTFVPEINFDIGGLRPGADARQDTGFDVDGIVGYDFGTFRLEAEVGYRESRLKSYTSLVAVPIDVPAFAPAGRYNNPGGRTSALSFMVNGLIDFGDDDGISGFAGGGIGVSKVKFAEYRLTDTSAFLNDADTGFAWQAIAGVRVPLTNHLDVSLKYRFFNVDAIDMIAARGERLETQYRSHSILGGLTYNFGGPPPPPPPPPPPEPNPNPTEPVV